MGLVSRAILKSYFERGDQPTEAQFVDLIDTTFNDLVNVKSYGASGNGINDDTSAIQTAIDSGNNIYFDSSIFVCSNVDFSNANNTYVFANTTLKRVNSFDGSDPIIKTTASDITFIGRLNLDGNAASGSHAAFDIEGDDFKGDYIFVSNLNTGGATEKKYGVAIRNNASINKVRTENIGYGSVRIHLNNNDIDNVYISTVESLEFGYKGFGINSSSFNLGRLRIDNYYANSSVATVSSDGFLADTQATNSNYNIDYISMGSMDIRGPFVNGMKIENTTRFDADSVRIRNASSGDSAAASFRMSAKYCSMSSLDADNESKVWSNDLWIGNYINISSDTVVPLWFEESHDSGAMTMQVDKIMLPNSTRTNGFIRIEVNGVEFNGYIGLLKTPDQKPLNIASLPSNQSGFIKIDRLVGYTGQDWTGNTNNNSGVLINPRFFILDDEPTQGSYIKGDIVFYNDPSLGTGTSIGEVCVVDGDYSGSPPTFKPFSQAGIRTTSSDPNGSITPRYQGEELLDTNNEVWYKSVGTSNTDWKALN